MAALSSTAERLDKPQASSELSPVIPRAEVIHLTRKMVAEIPQTTKYLRLMEQEFNQGTLTYCGKGYSDGSATVTVEVELPPDPKETFEVHLDPREINSLEGLKETFRQTVVEEYVFKNLDKKDNQKRKGFGPGDIDRVYEMAEHIHQTFSV